jgi:hypothetical protein
MVDLGISRGKDPFIQGNTSYPPTCTRVNASWNALLPDQRSCPTAQKIYDAWQRHSLRFAAAQSYRIGFSEELITAMTNKVVSLLQTHRPNTSRYHKCLPTIAEAKAIGAGIKLEDLINAGVTILFEVPDDFSAWQQTGRSLIA